MNSSGMLAVGSIEAHVKRKRIRHLYLSVKPPGTVHVRAPYGMSEEFIRRFIISRQAWIEKQKERVKNHVVRPRLTKAQLIKEWNRRELTQVVQALCSQWEEVMGLQASRWTIRHMKTRWGSCNPCSKRISLSLTLAAQPIECIEYVVVHELVHFWEKGHGARFKEFMTKYLPDWKQRKKLLNGKC